MMYSRTMVRELIFAVEIILAVLFLAVALTPVGRDLLFASDAGRLLDDGLVLYIPAPDGVSADDIAASDKDIKAAYRSTDTLVSLGRDEDGLGISASLVTYVGDAFEKLASRASLAAGRFERADGDTLPVVICSALGGRYSVGDTFTLTYDELGVGGGMSGIAAPSEENGETERFEVTVRCRVSGILEPDAVVPAAATGTPATALSYAALDMAYCESNGDDYIFAAFSPELLPNIEPVGAAFFEIDGSPDGLRERYEGSGEFHTVGELRQRTVRDAFRESEWPLLLLFLFVIVVFVSCVCYITVNVIRGQRRSAVLLMCGLSPRRAALLDASSLLLIVVPSAILGLLAAPAVVGAIGAGSAAYFGRSAPLSVAVAALFTFSSLIGAAAGFARRHGASVINIYREG